MWALRSTKRRWLLSDEGHQGHQNRMKPCWAAWVRSSSRLWKTAVHLSAQHLCDIWNIMGNIYHTLTLVMNNATKYQYLAVSHSFRCLIYFQNLVKRKMWTRLVARCRHSIFKTIYNCLSFSSIPDCHKNVLSMFRTRRMTHIITWYINYVAWSCKK